MKLFKMLITGAMAMTVSAPALADYYEYLGNQFKAANENISLDLIPIFGHPDAPYCIEFTKEQPLDEFAVKIGIYTRTSDGPGPGLPPISISKVLLATNDYQDVGSMFNTATLKVTAKQIETTQTIPDKFTLQIRKGKDFVYFKRARTWTEYETDPKDQNKTIEVTKTEDRYGYCYPKPSQEKAAPAEAALD